MIDIRATRSPVIPAKAGIQYAAASRFYNWRSGILGRPVKPGDDTLCTCGDLPVGLFRVQCARQNISLPRLVETSDYERVRIGFPVTYIKMRFRLHTMKSRSDCRRGPGNRP